MPASSVSAATHPRTPSQQTAPAVPHQPSNEPQMPASGEITVKDAKTFSGNIVKENGELVLKDPVTKVSYKLSDSGKAHRYKGKRVKVTGKLDANSNTIQVEKIEPIS